MTSIVSQFEELDQNQGELDTTATTLINQEVKKFPVRPIAVVSSVRSIAQTWVKPINTGVGAKRYYLPQRFQSLASRSLTPYPYQVRTIEDQLEEFDTNDIAVHTLAQPTSRQNIGFVQASARVKDGKFLTPPIGYSSTNVPRSQSKLQEIEADQLETDEEEPFWRGIFALPRSSDVLFSKKIELKVDELPAWKPHVVIDSYRLEDDDE
ncbi:MAG: hypothetical protein RIG63_10275 [Coleofasciculus chthonoplastes F3-SA18-01]|uniref:hypothetical protein n=1 Tax=Coleofasciculus chthonoplastes TaxID=64178 RepID=UPI0032F1AF41